MLVLSRRNGETISLPDHDIHIRVLRVSGSRVQIGIDAPKEIAIRRSELIEKSMEEGNLVVASEHFDDPTVSCDTDQRRWMPLHHSHREADQPPASA